MAYDAKKYVDKVGLGHFLDKLKIAYANNDDDLYKDLFKVAQAGNATTADSATKASQDGSGNVIAETYVPVTRTVAGCALSANISAADLRSAVTLLDGVSLKGSGETTYTDLEIDSNKKALLDLSGYALKSDLVAVLKFKGVKDYVKDLPTATADTVGHIYHVKYAGTSGTEPLNAEYVGVDLGESASPRYKFEEMGSIVDLSEYKKWDATKTYIDDADTSTFNSAKSYADGLIAALDAEVTSTDGSKVTVKVTEADGKITAVNVTESDIASAELLGTSSSTAGDGSAFGAIKQEAADRATAITTAIEALDATQSQTSAAGNGYLALSITETDGKITAISGSVDSTKYDAAGAASTAESNAKSYTDTTVAGLDATVSQTAGTDGLALTVVETDGKLTSVSGSIAANTYDAYGEAAAVYAAIGSVPNQDSSEGANDSIDSLFPKASS